MAASLHLLCRDRLGIRCVDRDQDVYTSEAWAISAAEAAKIIGGRVYFHQTKADPSYFGGDVLGVEPVHGEGSDPERFILRLTAQRDAKGVAWNEAGQSHAMAWSSGVLED